MVQVRLAVVWLHSQKGRHDRNNTETRACRWNTTSFVGGESSRGIQPGNPAGESSWGIQPGNPAAAGGTAAGGLDRTLPNSWVGATEPSSL
eukprot:1192796-Prorocentrum_minimum.AAC.6